MHAKISWEKVSQQVDISYLLSNYKNRWITIGKGSIVCSQQKEAKIYSSIYRIKYEFLTCLQLYLVSEKRSVLQLSKSQCGKKLARGKSG